MEFLSRRGIAYEGRDISEKQEFMAELVGMGYMGTPVTLIGDEAVMGYSRISSIRCSVRKVLQGVSRAPHPPRLQGTAWLRA